MKTASAKTIKIIMVAILLVLPAAVSAYTFLEPLPGLGKEINTNLLATYTTWLFRFALATAAFLAVMQIVIGAMHIIVGGASESSQTKGRGMIEMALWGLLLAVSSVLILETINPDLVKTGLNIPNIEFNDVMTGGGDGADGGYKPPAADECKPRSGDGDLFYNRKCVPISAGCPESGGWTDISQLDCGYVETCCEKEPVPMTGG